MNKIKLEALIAEQKSQIENLKYGWSEERGELCYYYSKDDSLSYNKWIAKTWRYLSINYANDKCAAEFESVANHEISREQQEALLAILEAIVVIPQIVPSLPPSNLSKSKGRDKEKINIRITNNNSQSQTQTQSLAVEIFLEAIKDDLTGRQIKELKSVVNEAGNDLQKARSSILEKLKSFGSDVASNIVANLLINPNIWCGL